MQDYKVQLDTYSGPMDLLLYLIRREEVDIYDIPIAHILGQYLEYVRLLEMLDPDTVGDFLVLAATLMEIKSRMLLPKPPPDEGDEDLLDPRADLVRQLLAYRAYREAADQLRLRKDLHSRRFSRPPVDVPDDEEQVDIEDAQIWDLLTAFNKLLASIGQQRTTHDIIYDDTPVTLHAADILDRLERDGPVMGFEQIFEGRTRSEMIGLFLALLELIRQYRIRVEQADPLGNIKIHLLDPTPITGIADTKAVEDEREEDEYADAPFEEEKTSAVAPDDDYWDEGEEEDEYSRQIDAVQVGEVDMGRSEDDAEIPDDDVDTTDPDKEENPT
ncbi:MAG: segregation/condensation protein A [Planctomycetota bacterium]|nr:MAG: segregation/condensation protein A [Planctomycetota bacterium]